MAAVVQPELFEVRGRQKRTQIQPLKAPANLPVFTWFDKTPALWLIGQSSPCSLTDAVAVRPSNCPRYPFFPPLQFELMRVDIETCSSLSAGQTVCDIWGQSTLPKNCRVAKRMDVDGFWELMTAAIDAADLAAAPMNNKAAADTASAAGVVSEQL